MTASSVYRHAIERYIGVPEGHLDQPGTSIHPLAEREESGIASAYRIGDSTTIWCASRHVPLLADLTGTDPLELDAYEAWCRGRGGELIGGASAHVLAGPSVEPTRSPAAAEVVPIDRSRPRDVASTRAFLAGLDPDDADAAEIDPDDLDEVAVLLHDSRSRPATPASFASWRPWWVDARFGDIGVVTAPTHRRGGWGRAAVAAVVAQALDRAVMPLYRCDDDNEPSRQLALSLGFAAVSRLRAVRLPE